MKTQPLPLTILLARYCRVRPDLAAGTIEQMAISLRLFERFLGRTALINDLTAETCADWARWMAGSRSPATVRSKISSMMTLWRFAAEARLTSPPRRPVRWRVPDRLPIVWSLKEVARLLAAADRQLGFWGDVPARLCWRILVLMIWDTGARIGEVRQARVSDVDLARATWLVPAAHSKGRRRDRLYRLHRETTDLIRASLLEPRHLLLPYPRHWRSLWVDFSRLLVAAGLPSDRAHKFHCLRRTAESYAAASRGIAWAAQAVGHTPAVAARHYVNPLVGPCPGLVDAVPRPHGGCHDDDATPIAAHEDEDADRHGSV